MGPNLTSRVRSEKAAYNDGGVHARSTRLQYRFRHVFECPNAVSADRNFRGELARRVPGKAVLEYGCYRGAMVAELAALGPRQLLGIDISDTAIAHARANYGHLAEFAVMDAHNLELPDESFDVLVGGAILHHLDFDRAIREVHRVLRPGGTAIFIEPLRDNPAGKLLRALTPAARTSNELPLSRKQIRHADAMFSANRHHFAGLVSAACGLVSSLVCRDPANIVMRAADRADRAIARTPLRWWMRMAVLCWTK